MSSREQLQQLVLSLPDDALAAAHVALTELQAWPPALPAELERVQQQAAAWMADMREHGTGGGGVGGGSWGVTRAGTVRGRHSFESGDGDESVTTSHIIHDGCEFTLVERIRRNDGTGDARFVIELTGPDGTTARHDHRYTIR